MVEIQWQEWQDELPDGPGPFAVGEGIPAGWEAGHSKMHPRLQVLC
jgi:hypothetical protein